MTSQDDGTTESAPQVPSTSNSSEISCAGPTPGHLDAATRRFAVLEQVGQHSADLMVVIDQSGAVLYANPTATETLGISLEEGLGTNAFKYLHPDDEQRVILRFLDIVATPGISIRDTIRTLTEAGETRVLEIVSTNSIDNTAVGGIIVNGHDITDQQKYVTQLQEYEERFRLAFEGNMAPMILTDLEDRVIAANDAFCSMIGFSREELLGKDSVTFTYPEDVGITEDSHRRTTRGELGQSRYVKRYLRKDGRIIFTEVSRSPARDAQGRTLYFVISERDITEERGLTEQLSH